MRIIILFIAVLCYGEVKHFSTYNRATIRPVSIPRTNGFDHLVPDHYMTSDDYTLGDVVRFLCSYSNRLSTGEMMSIYLVCKEYTIHPLMLCAKIEIESGIISWSKPWSALYERRKNWCLGAGMYDSIMSNGHFIKPNYGFDKQLDRGCASLRKHYDAWKRGMYVVINEGMHRVYPRNAVTYALYKYTPYWGTWIENGVVCSGNEYFVSVYKRFEKRWNSVN